MVTLQETLPAAARRFTTTGALASTYLRLLGLGRFMGYSLSTASMGAAFQAFLAGAPFALIVVMGVSPEDLWIFIMSVPAGYIVGNYVSSWASQRISRDRMILAGSVLAILCTGVLVALSVSGLDSPFTLIAPLFVYSVGSGFLVPNSLAGALVTVEPAAAGSAAALGGFVQMGSGALATVVVAALTQTSFLQVGAVMLGCTFLSWLFFALLVRKDPAR